MLPARLVVPLCCRRATQTVPVTFTLLDENREPYGRSDVEICNRPRIARLWIHLDLQRDATQTKGSWKSAALIFSIHWNSKGQPSGYSNRFYLLVNAGCQYGQTEFWLDVYNWS